MVPDKSSNNKIYNHMAKIMYQTENNLLLDPRESFYRPFNFGEWTDLRIGMLFRLVSTTSDSSSIITETVGANSETDRFYFGIKDSGNNMPGVAGTKFIGMGTVSGSTARASSQGNPSSVLAESGSTSSDRLYFSAYSGSTFHRPIISLSPTTAPQFSGSASGSLYNAFYGLKIELQNSGASNQRVQVTYRSINGFSGVAPGSSSAELHAHLSSHVGWTSPYDTFTPATASWVTGIPLPDSFFVYSPMYNNRLRLSAIQVLKIS